MNRDRQSRLSAFFSNPDTKHTGSSGITRSSSPSSIGSDAALFDAQVTKPVVMGVCAMDVKARSRAMREIIIRIKEKSRGAIEVKVFGDKVILDEGERMSSAN